MLPKFLEKSDLAHKPGVYLYRDNNGDVIYVGKAIDLNNRVSSYFNNRHQTVKTNALVNEISSVETIVVESELQALILEANLIKRFLPRFNVRLTDDKDYLYIKVTKEDFPKVVTARKHDLKDAKAFFGPFPSSTVVKSTLKKLRRVFPWCSNPISSQKGKFKGKACFYYHIHLCPGACVGQILKEDYQKIIRRFVKFMSGDYEDLIEELGREMAVASEELEFEKAAAIKKILDGVVYVTSATGVSMFLDNPNFLEDQRVLSLEEMQRVLGLKRLPSRIETYDISNIQGKQATGSMVVLTDGEIDKSQYRRFKIKISGKPNDYAMHAEMMRRRLKHKDWPLPQLMLIDGGRGQVRASEGELSKLGIKVAMFGIAKREEWLYPSEGEVIKLPKRSLALRLIQKIRDEAHRFAISYHRKLRSEEFGLSK